MCTFPPPPLFLSLLLTLTLTRSLAHSLLLSFPLSKKKEKSNWKSIKNDQDHAQFPVASENVSRFLIG